MTVFERIENLRKDRDLSQGALEKELGISNGSVSKWKNSKPSANALQKLSNYFNVSISYLLEGEQDPIIADAILDVRIAKDKKLKKAIEKYYTLDSEKQDYVINLIDMLSRD